MKVAGQYTDLMFPVIFNEREADCKEFKLSILKRVQNVIGILQPLIPHYREDFFKGLSEKCKFDIYCYESKELTKKNNFNNADILTLGIWSVEKKGFLFYNPFTLLRRKYSTLVLMLNIGHITTWLLLLTSFIHRKKIIVWGHGISVKRYWEEEKKPSVLIRWMIRLSDGVWFYTEREQEIWRKVFPKMKSVALNNTISDVDNIVNHPVPDKKSMKEKYQIVQPVVFIFCARFNSQARRSDLLIKAIKSLDSSRFGFIIVGGGKLKPDFGVYSNVYDFGEVYDRRIKDELFAIADIYFQPAWIGLSVVEAMAYGKPVFSMRRSAEILQGVEYGYIHDGYNGLLFDDIDKFIEGVSRMEEREVTQMKQNAKIFTRENLDMDRMVNSALKLIGEVS